MQYKSSLVRMNKLEPEIAIDDLVLSSYVPPITAVFKILPESDETTITVPL